MQRSHVISIVLAACALARPTISLAQHQTADDEFTMALTGDSIITRKLSVYEEPEFLQMIELLRSADMAFTNLEMLFHDYEPYPMAESGGTWMRADPALVDDLVWGPHCPATTGDPYATVACHIDFFGCLRARHTDDQPGATPDCR